MSEALPAVIGIVGPTAVGKSAVAEAVGLEVGGEIVSVDSMQVYRGMDIGTAKVPEDDRLCALHMVDIVDPLEDYSVACFQSDARLCIDELIRNEKVAVLCGGTGLYLDAVIDEMTFPTGKKGDEGRSKYEEIARNDGESTLYGILESRDPQSAALIHPHNVRRVVRALEMLDEGTSYAEQHKGLKQRMPHYEAHLWALTLPRDELYRRIDARVDEMFRQGLVDEVARLASGGLNESVTAGMAIGYKEVLRALSGDITLDEARELIKRNSRRYAKRQLSWLRRDGRARWLDMSCMDISETVDTICDDWRVRTS